MAAISRPLANICAPPIARCPCWGAFLLLTWVVRSAVIFVGFAAIILLVNFALNLNQEQMLGAGLLLFVGWVAAEVISFVVRKGPWWIASELALQRAAAIFGLLEAKGMVLSATNAFERASERRRLNGDREVWENAIRSLVRPKAAIPDGGDPDRRALAQTLTPMLLWSWLSLLSLSVAIFVWRPEYSMAEWACAGFLMFIGISTAAFLLGMIGAELVWRLVVVPQRVEP